MEQVIHIMADGTVRDSVEGLTVPTNNPVYDVLSADD